MPRTNRPYYIIIRVDMEDHDKRADDAPVPRALMSAAHATVREMGGEHVETVALCTLAPGKATIARMQEVKDMELRSGETGS